MKGLIDEAIVTNPQPEYIRYIAFIVFSDIYRHYNRMSSSTTIQISNCYMVQTQSAKF
ncbi:hypothetical protein MGH68_01590 [Erysipelothrix sp. D19-032]